MFTSKKVYRVSGVFDLKLLHLQNILPCFKKSIHITNQFCLPLLHLPQCHVGKFWGSQDLSDLMQVLLQNDRKDVMIWFDKTKQEVTSYVRNARNI